MPKTPARKTSNAYASEADHITEEREIPGFLAGYRSYWAGKKMDDNPFEEGTKEALDYERGWRHALAWRVAEELPH